MENNGGIMSTGEKLMIRPLERSLSILAAKQTKSKSGGSWPKEMMGVVYEISL
jgi:hypothetical protein